ncbi:hypothetical protein [Aeromonas hydrophila]|uniref:hypothetical protein n=1 Tax=Aeromonas hydrophila TaxID=644 RepID=UPI003D1DD288
MKDKLKDWIDRGSGAAGWAKVLTLLFVIMTGCYAYYYNTNAEINTLKEQIVEEQGFRKQHYKMILDLQKSDDNINYALRSQSEQNQVQREFNTEVKEFNKQSMVTFNDIAKTLVKMNTHLDILMQDKTNQKK